MQLSLHGKFILIPQPNDLKARKRKFTASDGETMAASVTFNLEEAVEWLEAFESDGAASVQAAFDTLLEMDATDYIEGTDAAHGLAAAEMVAAARDDDTSRLPKAALSAFKEHKGDVEDADLAASARKVVVRILKNSELKDTAESGDEAEEWTDDIRELLERLKG
jgi:Domain of unknown function (DUF4259)